MQIWLHIRVQETLKCRIRALDQGQRNSQPIIMHSVTSCFQGENKRSLFAFRSFGFTANGIPKTVISDMKLNRLFSERLTDPVDAISVFYMANTLS